MEKCKCGKNNWEWQLDSDLSSWIRCANCDDNMFEKGIGVILINWDFTNTNEISIEDVLCANKYATGVVVKNEN